MLVLAGTAKFKADSVAAWLEVHAQRQPSSQCDFVHYSFDESIKPLVLLDLLSRVRAHFFELVIILPPASTWSRARHTGSAQQPLRSRSNPLGLDNATANNYDRIQHSNKVVEVSWWFSAVALTAEKTPVQMILLFPEDLGGDRVSGPSSIWALEGFRLLQDVGEARRGAAFFCQIAGAEHRRPTGVLTNVKGMERFLNVGWPSHKIQEDKLQYLGPLSRSCPCVSDHPPMEGEIEGGFNSSTAPLLTRLFWARLFSALSPVSGNVALRDGVAVFPTCSSSLRSLLQATSFSPIGCFPCSLSALFSAWVQGLLTRAFLRDFDEDAAAIDGYLDWDFTQLPLLDSRTRITSSCGFWSSASGASTELATFSSFGRAGTGTGTMSTRSRTPRRMEAPLVDRPRGRRDGNGRSSLPASGRLPADSPVRYSRLGATFSFPFLSVF